MEVVGRDRELARVEFFLDSMRLRPSRLLLEGEAGIGKTTVWRAGLHSAESRHYRVLSCRPAESESSLGYAGLGDLLADLDPDAFETLPEPQKHALEVALLRAPAPGRPPDARAIFTALVTILRALAGERPVLVAIDDLQWLDGASLRALEFAGRRLRGLTVGVLASVRVDFGAPVGLSKGWIEVSERLRLEELSPAALQRVIKDRLGWSVPRPTLMRLHEACGGNAFFALEVAHALLSAGKPDPREAWPIPRDVRDLVDLRVGRLPEAARRALLEAAAVSQPTVDVFGKRALRAAERAGIVSAGPSGRVRFAHPLYASAVYLSAPPELRRQVHAQLAASETDIEERARQLALAATGPDEGVAAELDLAAERARSRGAPEIAAELEERALELTPPADRVRLEERSLAASAHYFSTGALARARALLIAILAESDDRVVRARALHLLAQVRFREESIPEAMELMRSAALAAGDDSALRAPIELFLTFASSVVSFEEAQPHAELAIQHAERMPSQILLAEALAVKTVVDFMLGGGLDEARIARALDLEDPDRAAPVEVRPTLIAGFLALYTTDYERARSLLYPLRARLRERGEDSDLPLLCAHMAWLECSSGEFAAAQALAEEALETAALGESGPMTALALAFAALVDAHAGHERSCRQRVDAALLGIERAGFGLSVLWSRSALGLLELSLGDAEAAGRALEPLTQDIEEHGLAEPIRGFFLPDAIEALVELGQLDRAQRLTELLASRARALNRPWAIVASDRCLALLLAAQGRVEAATTVAEHALAKHDRVPMPLERARTLMLKGQLMRRAKRKAAANASLQEALDLCETLGAALWAERARAELTRLGPRRTPDELTATEERVATLAASGLTNREVANAAFMSQKTVEANLSRVYRKLGIRSRAELGVRLANMNASDQHHDHPLKSRDLSTPDRARVG